MSFKVLVTYNVFWKLQRNQFYSRIRVVRANYCVALAIVSKFNHKLRSKSSNCECKWKKLMVLLLLLYEETFKYCLSCFSINYALFPDASWRISLANAFLLSHVTTIDSCFEQFYRWCSAGRKSQCTNKQRAYGEKNIALNCNFSGIPHHLFVPSRKEAFEKVARPHIRLNLRKYNHK